MSQIDLSKYDNSWYSPGSRLKMALWYITSNLFFTHGLFPFSSLKLSMLRAFGADIGNGVVIKPHVTIKYPWLLSVGSYSWIGEGVWLDNLDKIEIGSNVCLSQGALLECGNHNYKKSSFDLIVEPITIKDGAWVGARSKVGPGVIMEEDSILTMGSVAVGHLETLGIYKGNPAVLVKKREVE